MSNAWDDLIRELDCWAEAGRTATFWWRDDDAVAVTPALDRLLDLAGDQNKVIALAVIPASATAGLAARVADLSFVRVLPHGFAHANHAPALEKKCEYPASREAAPAMDELARGLLRIRDLFGAVARPVLTPPWNRIAGNLLPRLPRVGFIGLSSFGPRPGPYAAPGLAQVNSHVDPVAWRGGRAFLGDAAALGQAVGHLAARRRGLADPDEPTGLLTHHLVHDTATWSFVRRFLLATSGHPAGRWLDPEAAFGAE